jgi:hypothetical protein
MIYPRPPPSYMDGPYLNRRGALSLSARRRVVFGSTSTWRSPDASP